MLSHFWIFPSSLFLYIYSCNLFIFFLPCHIPFYEHAVFTVYSTVDGQLSYCQVGNITNTPTMDILVRVFRCAYVLISSGFKPRSETAESYGNSVFNLKSHPPVFHSAWTILLYHQQCTRFWFLHIVTNTCYFPFLKTDTILVGVKCYFIVVLTCIFTRD